MKKKKKKYFLNLAEKHRGNGETPECMHFDKCGGCMFQDIPYENQLLLKKEYINTLLEGIVSIDSVNSANPFNYRSRMDMVTAFGKFGLREAGSYRFVVDIESCPIMQEKMNLKFQKVRSIIKDVEDYDYLRHEGYLRYVVLREAKFTGEIMVNFVIAKPENRLQKIIEEIYDEVDSISLILSDGLADLSYGKVFEDIKKGYIEEDFQGIKYRLTPNSFFQSNSLIALQMYEEIKKEVSGKTLDLYSGIGSISLFVAENTDEITGVEMVEESVEAANLNKEINEIENAQFIASDVKEYIIENKNNFDTVILDPPRSGIHPKVIPHINNLGADKIIYMSCNPATFKNDIEGLNNYEITSFAVYDMFPQTPHVETLAIFKKIN